MPSEDRYVLNDLQQAVLDELAGAPANSPMISRDKLIAAVQQVPGLDGTTGMAMGPCLSALKRRGLIAPAMGSKSDWYITPDGLEYVTADEDDDEPKPDPAPASAVKESLTTDTAETPDDAVTHIDPDARWALPPGEIAWVAGTDELVEGARFDDKDAPEHRPDYADPGEPLGGMDYPADAQPLGHKRSFDALPRQLEVLFAHGDLASRHDPDLQEAVIEVIRGIGIRAAASARSLQDHDPARRELFALSGDCCSLANQVEGALIVPGHAPGREVAA